MNNNDYQCCTDSDANMTRHTHFMTHNNNADTQWTEFSTSMLHTSYHCRQTGLPAETCSQASPIWQAPPTDRGCRFRFFCICNPV